MLTCSGYGLTGTNEARFRFCAVALAVLLLGLTGGIRRAAAYPSNNVPLDNWSYEALDKLAGFGLINSDVHGMRPYTRLEVARLVNEALDTEKEKKLKLPPLIEYLLKRLQREYREELAFYGRGKAGGPAVMTVKPLEEAKATYVYSGGRPRDFLNVKNGVKQYPRGSGGIIATEGTPLIRNNDGVVYGKGNNFSFQFASSFQLWGLFSGYVEPIAVLRENSSAGESIGVDRRTVGSFDTADLDLLKGYVKFSPLDFFEVEAGRDSMWWGQGYAGALILTDNAPPLDMIKVSNPTPTILPWYFRYLGPFKYAFFIAELEGDRDYPHAKYGGARIDFKPTPDLEIGMSHTFQFGGSGSRSSGSFFNYLKLLSLAKTEGGGDPENHEAAFDFRYRIPYLWNTEIYGEWGGELNGFKPNLRTFFFQDIGWLLGAYFPRITPDGRTDLRIEYADNVNEGGPGSKLNNLWYAHSLYTSGMTYEGMILGDAMGPDARSAFARISSYVRNNLKVGVDAAVTERGVNVGRAVEREYRIGADATYNINDALTARVRYGWGAVRNFDLTRGDNRQENLLMFQMEYDF